MLFLVMIKEHQIQKNAIFLKDGVCWMILLKTQKPLLIILKMINVFSEIILAGHSQGSLVAILASEKVDKFISLAGAGERIDKILKRQLSAQNPLIGKPVEDHFKELKETGDIKEVNPSLVRVFSKQNLPFLTSWVNLNPIKEIKKITIPILIINGDKDLQVRIQDAKNLHAANPKSELVIIKNMNHVLKEVKDEDNLKSYYSPNYPLSKELIKTVVTFIKK